MVDVDFVRELLEATLHHPFWYSSLKLFGPWIVDAEAGGSLDPEQTLSIFQNGGNLIAKQRGVVTCNAVEVTESETVETAQSSIRTKPKKPTSVLGDAVHSATSQSVTDVEASKLILLSYRT